MKLAFCTLVEESYADMCIAMLYSLVKNNPTLEFDFIVFKWNSLSDRTMGALNKIHPTKFIDVKEQDYEDCLTTTTKWRHWEYNPFFRFEIFTLSEYDKIIYIDSDTMVLKDLNEFVNLSYDFYASCIEKNSGMEFADCDRPRFNAGVMGISKKFLTDSVRVDLIKISELQQWSGNQTPLNLYFQNIVTIVDSKYNLQSNQFNYSSVNDAHIIHFIGNIKPTNDLNIMSNAYPLYCFGSSKIVGLYTAWDLFRRNFEEAKKYVS